MALDGKAHPEFRRPLRGLGGVLALFLTVAQARGQEEQPQEMKALLEYKGSSLSFTMDNAQDQGVEFRIEPGAGMSYDYFRLEKPNRIVIDIDGAKLERPQVLSVENNPLVKRVRVGVYPDKTRIVLDVKGTIPPGFEVRDEGPAKVFSVKPKATSETELPLKTAEQGALSVEQPPAATPVQTATATSEPSRSEPPSEKLPAPAPTLTIFLQPTLEAPTAIPEEVQAVAKTPPPATSVDNIPAPPEQAMPEEREGAAIAATAVPEQKLPGEKRPAAPSGGMRLGGVEVSGFDGVQKVKIPAERLQELAKINFSVDKVLLTFKSTERPVENIEVRNPGQKEIYVSAIAQKLKNSGLPDEQRTETQDLLVSPRRFSIPAGGTKSVRVLLKELPPDIERAYNIAFSVNRDSFEAEYIQVEIDGKPGLFRVITNLGILVLAEPPNPRALIGAERRGEEITISNRGTVSVRLTGGKVCNPGATKCFPISPRRLFPENTWTLKVPPDWAAYFVKDSVLGYEQLFIPAQSAE